MSASDHLSPAQFGAPKKSAARRAAVAGLVVAGTVGLTAGVYAAASQPNLCGTHVDCSRTSVDHILQPGK